jgi:hypothetical protein
MIIPLGVLNKYLRLKRGKVKKKLNIWYIFLKAIQDMDQGPTSNESGNKPPTEKRDGKKWITTFEIKEGFLRITLKDLRRFGWQ